MKVENKTVLITGGASGIGKIMARLLLEREAKVIIWDINQEGIDKVIEEFSDLGTIIGYKINVSDIEEIQSTAQKLLQQNHIIDILINNAGIIVGK